ncbi:hypothetical protein SRHO_G00337150 [Serrasalmus rhombeus]
MMMMVVTTRVNPYRPPGVRKTEKQRQHPRNNPALYCPKSSQQRKELTVRRERHRKSGQVFAEMLLLTAKSADVLVETDVITLTVRVGFQSACSQRASAAQLTAEPSKSTLSVGASPTDLPRPGLLPTALQACSQKRLRCLWREKWEGPYRRTCWKTASRVYSRRRGANDQSWRSGRGQTECGWESRNVLLLRLQLRTE